MTEQEALGLLFSWAVFFAVGLITGLTWHKESGGK